MRAVTMIAAALLICQAGPGADIEVKNPWKANRQGEVISVQWNEVGGEVEGITAENARVLDAEGKVLQSQVADEDGDGAPDALLFAADIPAKETVKFRVVADHELEIPESEARVYARHVPERKDDFAWENDVVGFRAYGPALADGVENSGFDCFMKRVKYPVFDGWYKGAKFGKSYHIDFGEGYDGYKVGSSLGAGGSAVWREGELHLSNVYREHEQYSNGPLKAAFTLSYGPWEVDGKKITERKRISLELGDRLFKVEESFFVDGEPARLDVAVGVATHEGAAEPCHDKSAGWLYGWEVLDGQGFGTGVVIDPADADDIKEFKEIVSKDKFAGNAFFVVDTGADGKFTYYAGYGWEKAGEIETREEWEQYLKDWAEGLKHPLEVE